MESANREYKLKLTDDIEKTMVGFLNTVGGELLIGVDDKGAIKGLDNIDRDVLALSDRIKNNILPSIMGLFTIDLKEHDGKRYAVATIASGFERPYYIKKYGMSPKGCFIRIGSQTSPMEQSVIDNLYSRRILNTLHNVVSPRQNLTFSQLKIYYQEKGFVMGEFFLENLDLYTDDGKFNYAAYLMADNNATSIMVAKFAGNDKVIIQKKKDYGGCCLVKTAYNVLEALNIYNETAVEIKYPNRVETSLVDSTALREAALNAIIHNDYINGTDPVFEVYDDRIEIVSSGGLPLGLSQEEFFAGRSLPRNREVMRVFRDMELSERLGSGMKRIMKTYKPEDYYISQNFVAAKFKYNGRALQILKANEKEEVKKEVKKEAKQEVKTAGIGQSIISLISTNQNITIQEIAHILGITSKRAEYQINKLKTLGQLARVGSDKTGRWKIL